MTAEQTLEHLKRFYCQMAEGMLSEKEYEVIEKLLIMKMSISEVSKMYAMAPESVQELYLRYCEKIKNTIALLQEIDHYKKGLETLEKELEKYASKIRADKKQRDAVLQKVLLELPYHFSRRLCSMFETLDVTTIGDLADIPLERLYKYRGFKEKCKDELIAFIESENIQYLFKGFSKWKKIQQQ